MKIRVMILLVMLTVAAAANAMSDSPEERNRQHLILEEAISPGDANVGMVVTYPGEIYHWTAEDIFKTMDTVKRAGIKVSHLYYMWNEIEKKNGKYSWDELDFNLKVLSDRGIRASIVIKLIDTANMGQLPGDLSFRSFESESLRKRFKSFLVALLDRYKGQLDYVWIGNEIDGYFEKHRDQMKGFIGFYDEVYRGLKKKHPAVKVGTIFTFHDARNNNLFDIIREIGKKGDLIGFSFYPQTIKGATPADTGKFFNEMVSLSGKLNKNFVIAETGWSSVGLNGSESNQANFIRELFSAYRNSKSKVDFLGLFVLYDFPDSINSALADSYGMGGHKEFVQFQGSLGLAHNDGREKAGWKAMQEEMKKFK